MLKRKIENDLLLWLKSDKSLFIDGPRQVGKSYIIEHFAREHFENVVILDLAKKPDAIPVLVRDMDVDKFLINLSLVINEKLVEGKTLIFIDEIQKLTEYIRDNKLSSTFDLITLMKGLTQKNKYRFALSGSLLGTNLGDISLWPTGYMSSFTLYQLDFEEFLWANGVNDDKVELIRQSFLKEEPLDEYLHKEILDLFLKYVLVGGMPAAVNVFVETNNLYDVKLAHLDIETYNNKDVTKYARDSEKFYIKMMYDMIPSEISSKNKRFPVGVLKLKNKAQEVRNSFLWLANAGVAIPVWNTSDISFPLMISEERNLCKLFHEDTGLLTFLLMDEEIKTKILLNEKDINFGGIYENVIAQLLRIHGFKNIYYYNSKKFGEVDFVLEKTNGDIIPIEVKSGKDYARHVALNNLLANRKIKKAIVFYNGNVKQENKITYLPIYMVDLLRRL